LPDNKEHAICCGQGGHIYAANPELARKFTAVATAASKLPYITYCINCRELFLSSKKRSAHLLEGLFEIHSPELPVHLSQKARNRTTLKQTVLREFWGADCDGNVNISREFDLLIAEDMFCKMDRLLISEEEVYETICHCERDASYFVDRETATRIAYKKVGLITFWVEYNRLDSNIEVVNAYSHRIEFATADLNKT
jgi:hypothetical protein